MVPPYRPPEDHRERSRSRTRALVLGAAVLVAGAVGTAWAMVGPDSYGDASTGCVHVAIPSSTGGYLIDHCGSEARAWCASEVSATGMLADRARLACSTAGYGPRTSGGP